MKRLLIPLLALSALAAEAAPVTADSDAVEIAFGARAVASAATETECTSICMMYWTSSLLLMNTNEPQGLLLFLR